MKEVTEFTAQISHSSQTRAVGVALESMKVDGAIFLGRRKMTRRVTGVVLVNLAMLRRSSQRDSSVPVHYSADVEIMYIEQ